jgi:predicted ATPase
MPHHHKISRVVLRNYKSIQHCDIQLEPITFLVGPNGAGKSNFVEALRFLSYGLAASLEQALDNRSGFHSIVHRGPKKQSRISFEIFFHLGEEVSGNYAVEIGILEDGTVGVLREECSVQSASKLHWFKVDSGVVTSNQGVLPVASEDKLYLVNASGLRPFEPVYRALSNIVVYNPVPDEIRGFKSEKRYRNLDRTGSALAEIIFKLKTLDPLRLARVTQYVQRINPSVLEIDAVSVDANYNLRFELDRGGGMREEFSTQNISDGTLRALAVLIALFQRNERYPLTLVGLEEPEAGLHPAAANVLFDSFVEGSQFTQVVVTSHSPDLLDRDDIPQNSLKAVAICDGRTVIGKVDATARAALRDRLYTAGELMRMNQLRPEGAPDCADVR